VPEAAVSLDDHAVSSLAVAPDGRTAYVGELGSAQGPGGVRRFDIASRSLGARIAVAGGDVADLAVAGDGARVFATNPCPAGSCSGGGVAMIDTRTDTVAIAAPALARAEAHQPLDTRPSTLFEHRRLPRAAHAHHPDAADQARQADDGHLCERERPGRGPPQCQRSRHGPPALPIRGPALRAPPHHRRRVEYGVDMRLSSRTVDRSVGMERGEPYANP
jgi:hypothetical protein